MNFQLDIGYSFNTKSCCPPFSDMYHISFVLVVVIKSKCGVKVDMEQKMKIAICNLIPRFGNLCSVHTSCESVLKLKNEISIFLSFILCVFFQTTSKLKHKH